MRYVRPVWGSRSLFFVRAFLGTLAALVLVVWAVAAPRVLSPDPAVPSATPKASTPKPLRVPIGSFLSAKPSISNDSGLSKHASGSYSSGVAGVETRVIERATGNGVVHSTSGAKAKIARKHPRRVAGGDSTPAATPPTTTNTTPTTKPTTKPATPPATSPATKPVTPPAPRPVTPPAPRPVTPPAPRPVTPPAPRPVTPPTRTEPAHPPSHAPSTREHADSNTPGSHHDTNNTRGHGQSQAQSVSTGDSSCDRHPQDSHRHSGDPAGNGHSAEHHRNRPAN